MFNKNIKNFSIKYIFKKKNKNEINLSIGEIRKNNNKLNNFKNYNLYKFYPNLNNFKIFNKTIKKWIKKRYNINIKDNNICPSLGNRDGLFSSFLYLLNKKKYIVIFKPFYPIYIHLIKYFKKKPLYINEKNYKKKIHKNYKKINFIILCSPNNPTGKCHKKKFFIDIIKKNINIISDECYSEIYMYSKPLSILESDKKMKKIIILNSLSKRSYVPGLRSGFILSNKKYIRKIKKIKNICGTILSDFNKKISIELWKDNKHVEKIRYEYKKKIKLCYNIIKKSNIKFNFYRTGFYFWIKIKENEIKFCKRLYKFYKIKILPGFLFGKKNYIRIALVENIKKCIYSIKKIIKLINENRKN